MSSSDVSPGRKRDAARDGDLCRAALELLAEVGFGRMTMDAVAARAGAGKATVYRRWPGKAELVVDALSRMKAAPDGVDTGSLREDLAEFAGHLDAGDDPFQTSVTAGLVSSLVHDADLRAAFAEHFVAPRKTILRSMFERAAGRGEIPSRPDFGPLADVLPAMAIHRMITTGQPPDSGDALTLIDQVVLPLAHARVPVRDASAPTSDQTGHSS